VVQFEVAVVHRSGRQPAASDDVRRGCTPSSPVQIELALVGVLELEHRVADVQIAAGIKTYRGIHLVSAPGPEDRSAGFERRRQIAVGSMNLNDRPVEAAWPTVAIWSDAVGQGHVVSGDVARSAVIDGDVEQLARPHRNADCNWNPGEITVCDGLSQKNLVVPTHDDANPVLAADATARLAGIRESVHVRDAIDRCLPRAHGSPS
jgi:hypothetical protein